MSDYRNMKLKSILIPERDDDGNLTGTLLELHIASIEKMYRSIDGGMAEERLIFICFVNMPDREKKLYIIDPEEFEKIIVKQYDRENNETRNLGSPNYQRTSQRTRRDNYS